MHTNDNSKYAGVMQDCGHTPAKRLSERFIALYPEEGSIAKTSVHLDFLNNNVSITIFNFTMTNHAAQDFLSLLQRFIASFFDIGHQCYGQLTTFKTRYELTSIM